MSSVVISGDTSGSVTFQAPAVAGSTTLTLPATSGNVLTSTSATVGSSGITFSDGSTQTAAASPYVLKNRIINGAMVIDQRYAGAAGSAATNTAPFGVDRWQVYGVVNSKFTYQQNAGSVTPPAGFTNYFGITSSSAYTPGASERFIVNQYMEGFNTYDLDFGKSTAKTITLSFWVYSSLTGSFGGALQNYANTRSYPFSYTVSSANTWTQISITIPGDTSGTWVGASSAGSMGVVFSLGSGSTYQGTVNTWASANYVQPTGSVSVVGTNGATFYITGVQLEIGSSATPFERRLYSQEFINCQRYFEQFKPVLNCSYACGSANATNSVRFTLPFQVTKRTSPTMTYSAATTFLSQGNGANAIASAISDVGANIYNDYITITATATQGYSYTLIDYTGTSYIQASAEL
jgi:hypothetical protein